VPTAGTITQIGFQAGAGATVAQTATLEVYQGDGFLGPMIYTRQISVAAAFSFQTFPVLVGVLPGVYTFRVVPTAGFTVWFFNPGPYAGGKMYGANGPSAQFDPWDAHFSVTFSGMHSTATWWYEVDPTGMPNPVVQKDLEWHFTGAHLFFPSIAVNAVNDVCLSMAHAWDTGLPGGWAVGREAADPPGYPVNPHDPFSGASGMSAGDFLKGGEAAYLPTRWGDYSATVVDPVDDRAFWAITQYSKGPSLWSTWWTRKSAFAPVTMTSDITYPIDTVGGMNGPFAMDCTVPLDGSGTPGVMVVDAECDSASGSTITIDYNVTMPSGAPFDVELLVDGVVVDTSPLAAGVVPGPSALIGQFTYTLPLGGPYVVETFVDDGTGDADRCGALVTVVDTTPPTIVCPPNVGPLECTSPAGAVATWPDPTVTDVCDPAPTFSCEVFATPDPLALPVGTPVTSGDTFPLGVTTIECTGTDAAGLTDTCQFTIEVVDTTPPVVSTFVRRPMLFLPRNGLINVLWNYTTTDICDPTLDVYFHVWSNQPDPLPVDTGGLFVPDLSLDTVNTSSVVDLDLRAEVDLAAAAPPGRVYLIVVEAMDDSGNIGRDCAWVIVPKTATIWDVIGARTIAITEEAACPPSGGPLVWVPPTFAYNLGSFVFSPPAPQSMTN
jgi:hypothetical protein